MKRIILLSGKQGAGKSTIAKHLVEDLLATGMLPKILKFADPLYELHNACLPILKRLGIVPISTVKEGSLLQVLGTEYGREKISQDVWVKAARRIADEFLNSKEFIKQKVVIIDDCRFQNEFAGFSDAFKVRLVAPRDARKLRCSGWRNDEKHISETDLDEFEKNNKFDLTISTVQRTPQDVAKVVAHWAKEFWGQFI